MPCLPPEGVSPEQVSRAIRCVPLTAELSAETSAVSRQGVTTGKYTAEQSLPVIVCTTQTRHRRS
jgi:hypothetical protein